MAEADKIGVDTVSYNSADVLPGFLDSMMKQAHSEFLLFAVDNSSSDSTLTILRQCSDPRLRVIANLENRGVAAGNNQGIRAALEAGCNSVMLLNNDTEFDCDFLSLLGGGLERNDVDMVCPKIMYFDQPDRIWAAGGAFRPWLAYGIKHLGEGEIDRGQFNQAKLVTYVPTCCVLIRKEVFEKVGLMDERYFVYVDDVDFMYRALNLGIRLMYIPEAKLLHKVGSLTGGVESPFAARFCTRNRVYFLLRHFGILRALPILVLYQAHFIAGLLYGRFNLSSLAIKEKATWEGFTMWKNSHPHAMG